jgi:hypothetical protein
MKKSKSSKRSHRGTKRKEPKKVQDISRSHSNTYGNWASEMSRLIR